MRYHGDFDWPGIAIARRIIGQGAQPWRLGCADYYEAVERLPAGRHLVLTGRAGATPRDSELGPAMRAANVAVHEEAIVDLLLADLAGRWRSGPAPLRLPGGKCAAMLHEESGRGRHAKRS